MDFSEIFIKSWQEEKKMNMEEMRIFWDTKAHSYNKEVYEESKSRSELAEDFFAKGIIGKDSKVLDIGAGPGTYAIPFAKLVSEVTALDISEEMIGYLRENARKEELNNISAFKSAWEEWDTEKSKQYDLAFASMSPAINSYDSLMKMIKASKGYCYLSGFVYRKESVWDEIRDKILKKDKSEERQNKIYYAFNILWNMGINPEIEYNKSEHINTYETKDLIDMYTQKAKAGVKDITEKEIKEIEELIKSKEENSLVKEKMISKTASLLWRVSH